MCDYKLIGNYKLYEIIGIGGRSKVVRAVHRYTDEVFAVKVVPLSTITTEWRQKQIDREISCAKSAKHPNLCQLLDAFQSLNNVYLIFPYADKKDLHCLVRKDGALSEKRARHYFKQIVSGLQFLHNHQIVHRDIKLENVFLCSNDTVMLGDFGFSLRPPHGGIVFSLCGSPYTVAPEVVNNNSGYCGYAADIWSLGSILHMMVTAKYPFKCEIKDGVLTAPIINEPYCPPSCVSPELADLLCGMLRVDPVVRLCINEISGHPWLELTEDDKQLDVLEPTFVEQTNGESTTSSLPTTWC